MRKSITVILSLSLVLVLSMSGFNSWAAFTFNPNTIYMNWPTISTRVTDTFGSPRPDGRTHTGIDIGPLTPGQAGDSVYAALDGTIKANIDKSYGKVVYVNSQGYNPWLKKYEYVQTRYVHVDSYKGTAGQSVQRGQIVATMGGTFGYAVHLHYETRIGTKLDMDTADSATIPRDPLVSYTYAEPYRLDISTPTDSSSIDFKDFDDLEDFDELEDFDDVGEYGILKNSMLYTLDFILDQDPTSLSSYEITKEDLDELLNKLKDNNKTLYQKLYNYLE